MQDFGNFGSLPQGILFDNTWLMIICLKTVYHLW